MERKSAVTRRREALEAAVDIIGRDGIGEVSVRKVAAEAKMSVGSLRHIFPHHHDLLSATFQYSMQQTESRVKVLLEQAHAEQWGPKRTTIEVILQVLPYETAGRVDLVTQMALLIGNPKVKAIRQARQQANEKLTFLCESVLQRVLGSKPDPKRVRRLRLIIDGLALNMLDNPQQFRREDVEEVIFAELRSASYKNEPLGTSADTDSNAP